MKWNDDVISSASEWILFSNRKCWCILCMLYVIIVPFQMFILASDSSIFDIVVVWWVLHLNSWDFNDLCYILHVQHSCSVDVTFDLNGGQQNMVSGIGWRPSIPNSLSSAPQRMSGLRRNSSTSASSAVFSSPKKVIHRNQMLMMP